MKRIFVFIYILFLLSVCGGNNSFAQKNAERYSLAVLNFKMQGSSLFYSDVRFITGEFIHELVQANLFYAMSQFNVERGLIEKNIDPDSGCDEISCALKAAKALGVQLVMMGSLTEENSKFKLEVKMLHVLSKKVVKIQSEEYPNDLSQIYHNLPKFVSDFLGIPGKPKIQQVNKVPIAPIEDIPSPVIPEQRLVDQSEVQNNLPYEDFNYVVQDTTASVDTNATYYNYEPSEVIDTGAIYYPEESKLKKVLYWGLGAVAIGGVSASIIMLGSGSSGGGSTSNDLPDPPAFP